MMLFGAFPRAKNCALDRAFWCREGGYSDTWWSGIDTGWWFQIFFMFHNIWDVILPIDFHIFQRGRSTTNQDSFEVDPQIQSLQRDQRYQSHMEYRSLWESSKSVAGATLKKMI